VRQRQGMISTNCCADGYRWLVPSSKLRVLSLDLINVARTVQRGMPFRESRQVISRWYTRTGPVNVRSELTQVPPPLNANVGWRTPI
jgi:hypothetical protein